jgi:cephalosporin hydroxylase
VSEKSEAYQVEFYAGRKYFSDWCGFKVSQNPLDMWMYADIIHRCRPQVVVESGTAYGGTALFMAMVMDWEGVGRILTIDSQTNLLRPGHPRIGYVHGDCLSDDVLQRVKRIVGERTTMVMLDSNHQCDHVLVELDKYAPLVTPGQYLVLEDTNLHGHPVVTVDDQPGPYEALAEWLPNHPEFTVDPKCDFFDFTFHPGGWLLRGNNG